MRYGALAFAAVALSAPAASAQGMWWVEGDKYCNNFDNRSRNGAMCGSPKRGEVEPRPTYRLEFNSPRVPFIDDQQGRQGTLPAPVERPAAAPVPRPTRTQ